jgi:uncharacterized protein with PIN domain
VCCSELKEDGFERCSCPGELRSPNKEYVEDDVEPKVVELVNDE